MKFKHEVHYTLSTTDYISVAFNHLPFNAFIDKGRCAIGGTRLEIKDKTRSAIIVVSTKGIIEGKTTPQPMDTKEDLELKASIFPITKDTTDDEILICLKSEEIAKKIMVIPDNFKKIIDVATKNNLLPELYRDYFLLIDEAHAGATEDFREAITIPFDYFWKFDNKSLISATPFYFSDPRFQQLELHKIRFNNPEELETYVDDVTVIDANSPYAVLHKVIANTEGNLHIFLNSVTEMTKIIGHGDLKSCHVYCNGKEENITKLGVNSDCFKPLPINGEYAKVNFYTTRYFEGWDLNDDHATLILLTNVHQPHTKVGISNKGKQALGRIRTKEHRLIHITNHRRRKIMKTLDEISKEYHLRAKVQIDNYNNSVLIYKENGIEPTEEDQQIIKHYANIDPETKLATLKYIKVDQMINKQINDEQFNDISFIKDAWREAGFNVKYQRSNLCMESNNTSNQKRLSKAKQFENIVDLMNALYQEKVDFPFNTSDMVLQKIKQEHPFEYEAYHTLGVNALKEAKFNVKAIEKHVIIARNANQEVKLLRMIDCEFDSNKRYSKAYIKEKLQELYNTLGIIRNATAEQLGEDGRCDIEPCKIKEAEGKLINGFLVLRKQFELRSVV